MLPVPGGTLNVTTSPTVCVPNFWVETGDDSTARTQEAGAWDGPVKPPLTIAGGTHDETLCAPPLPDGAQPARIAIAPPQQRSRAVTPTRTAPCMWDRRVSP